MVALGFGYLLQAARVEALAEISDVMHSLASIFPKVDEWLAAPHVDQ